MSQIPHTSPFDGIRHEDEHGKEYWSARELYRLLGYTRWEKFQKSIEEAKIACENSNQGVSDHFHLEVQLIKAGKGARRPVEDYRLSRYACYLIYGGLRENDIHTRKGLTTDKLKISDYLGFEELGANIFRATQADAKLRRDQVSTKGQANVTHYLVGQEVSEAIKRLGGTMPEDLPTPEKSIQELQREELQRLKPGQQLSLLDEPDKEEQ